MQSNSAYMNAEILSVGTELLLGQILDTHAVTMAKLLASCGISCNRRATVGDNLDRIVATLQEMLARADVVVTIGGLGPTVDDLTRDAIALALGDELVHEPEVERRLKAFYTLRKLPWIETVARQALRPESAVLIDNPNGTAPGLLCQKNGKVVIALPGPKGEFVPMAEGPVQQFLSRLDGENVIHSRVLRICGMGESEVESKVVELMAGENPSLAPYAHTGEVHLRITARASSEAAADLLIDPVEAQIRAILGSRVFGVDETTLEQATIELAVARHVTLAVAESMTGGGLGERLSSVAGASRTFVGGVISYSQTAKIELLDVDPETLESFGPVSAEVVREMAEGARTCLQSDFGVAVSGNAGPTSDVDNKPVGLVFVAVAGPRGTVVEEAKFRGTREDIRRRATQLALLRLREALLELAPTPTSRP